MEEIKKRRLKGKGKTRKKVHEEFHDLSYFDEKRKKRLEARLPKGMKLKFNVD